MHSDQSSTITSRAHEEFAHVSSVPDLAETYGVREIDVWAGLVALIGWRASVLGSTHVMVVDGDGSAARGTISVDLSDSASALIRQVKDVLSSPCDDGRQHCDVALVWGGHTADLPDAPLVVTGPGPDSVVSYDWDPAMFDRAYVDNWHDHLDAALRSLANNPDQSVTALLAMTDKERALIDEANDTAHPITDCYVHDLLDRAIALYPDNVALWSTTGSLTYAELGARVDSAAAYLQEIGVSRGVSVGLLAERGLHLVTGMFAIMKAGGAIVPLSRAYPRVRIDEIVADSDVRVVVADLDFRDLLPDNLTVVSLDDPQTAQPRTPTPVNEPGDLCAILYTSGTSGVPKGVMVRHFTIVNAAEACRNEWRFGSTDAEPQFAPATFIAAINEVGFAMAAGGTLYLPGEEIIQDPRAFTMYAIEHQVTHIVTTPDYAQYLGQIPTVRTVVTLGAQCLPGVSAHLSGYEHINVYGLTEAGLALYWRKKPDEPVPTNIPIGRPIWNTQALVMRDGIECGTYMPGELCLAGACLSAGYKNLPRLNEERFVANPFGESMMFRTGDLVQWNADGEIEYIGRGDEQVQIHGQRVELGEVEHALLTFPGITSCCAIGCTDSAGDPAIAAFIVAELPLDCTALRGKVAERLVSYMVPSRLVQIDEIPRTANGKYDKQALLERLNTLPLAQENPSDGLEAVVIGVVENILPGTSVAPTDSFFALGGDSLTGVRFVNELEDKTGVRLPLAAVFEHPTPRELAAVLREQMSPRPHALKAIPSVGGPGAYPASPQQRRLFVVDQLDSEGLAYHIPEVVRMSPRIDPTRLRQVIQQLVDRHEVLRTSLEAGADGGVVQVVHDHATATIEVIDVENVSDETANQVLAGFVRPFDLGRAPLVRVMVAQGPDDQSLLLFDAHHSVLDGTSMTLLVEEFSRLLQGEALPPVTAQYKDYSAWLSAGDLEPARQYWANQFADPPAELDLPTDFPRPGLQTFAGASLTRTISPDIRVRVEQAAKRLGATEAMVMMAGWAAVMGRYGRTEDLVIGMPVSGRTHPDTESMLGMFVNTLPLRVHPLAKLTFDQYLAQVRDTMAAALSFQAYPLEDILDQIDVPRDLSRNPLFDTVLVFQNFAPADLRLTGLDAHLVDIDQVGANLDVSVYVTPTQEGGFEVVMEYRTDLFTDSTIDYMFRHLETFLDHATSTSDIQLSEISLIGEEERRFLDGLNDTSAPLRDVTVMDFYDEQVLARPDDLAVVFDGQQWTYGELDSHVRRIAAGLRARGVGPGTYVALWMGRSLDMVAAILSVLQAGGAYVPIGVDTPLPRMSAILDQCHPTVVLVNGATPPEAGYPVVDIASLGEDSDLANDVRAGLDDPAYCIFTSGSTGVPKGVVITHRSLSAFVQDPGLQELYHTIGRPVFAATADYSFDMFVTPLFAGLCRGMPMVLTTETESVNQREFAHLAAEAGVTIIQDTPTRLKMLTADPTQRDYLSGIELFMIGGEEVPIDLLDMLAQHSSAAIQVMYGPTETTEWSTGGPWTPGQPVEIGRALANEQILVVDSHGGECGIGMPGEIRISGVGLARGYLGDPELTAEKFTVSRRRSCLRQDDSGGDRQDDSGGDRQDDSGDGTEYRTGDLGLWAPDGNLRFVGRIDRQVKIHGVRIETGEVEHAIRDFPGVQDAAVVARQMGDDMALCAYYVAEKPVDAGTLREFVAARLPRTMLPSYWTHVDQLPVNRSGKTDLGALPDPEVRFADYVSPSTPTECCVAQAMAQVLGVERIGADDDFFALGGDSLRAMRLVNQIETLTGVRLGLTDVFRNPQPDELAGLIDASSGVYEPIVSAGGAGVYPASSPQRRLFVIDQLDSTGLAYHSPVMVRITGQITPDWLTEVFQALVDRHEVLRTSFMAGADGEVLQQIHDHLDADVAVIRADDVSDQAARDILAGFVRPFDLGEAPLVRMMLVQGPDDESLLLFDAHHIILDGTSMTLFAEEFSRLYQGETLPPVGVEHKDYVVWFAAQDNHEAREFWASQFSEPLATLDLVTDHPRPPVQTFAGARLTRSIPSDLRTRIEDLARGLGATEAMVMMAGWAGVLGKYGATDDLAVGMPVSGRVHPDTEHMLGMFVNTLPLRLRPHPSQTFNSFVADVRDTMMTSLAYQSYPLEDILDQVEIPRDLSRNPLFDTVLAFQNFAPPVILPKAGSPSPNPNSGGGDPDYVRMTSGVARTTGREVRMTSGEVRTTGVEPGMTSRFDLSVSITPGAQGYEAEVEYRTDLFDEATIDCLFRHLTTFLDHATDAPQTVLGQISMIDSDEQDFLDSLNDTDEALPPQRTIPELFAHVVAAYPDTIAVTSGGNEVTYRELDERVDRIAARLRRYGVGRDDLVGIYATRGLPAIEAILGVIVAGGAYVILDPAWPQARLELVCGDAHLVSVIVDDQGLPFSCGVPVLYLGDPDLSTGPRPILEPVNQPDDLAYCVYTSGSTGVPKGVLVENLGVCNLVNVARQYGITPDDRILAYASLTFDASVAEWAHALLIGGTLIVPTEAEATDLSWLNSRLTSDVTVMTAPPALIPHLDLTRLPRLISAGSQARSVPGFTGEFVNGYGPTEATVCSALWVRPDQDTWPDPIPIGHPRANLQAYVLSAQGTRCGIGVPGELCVAGVGLARGYLGDPELTASKFVPNPFGARQDDVSRMYHTGDRVVWGADGNLRFLGRIDEQVKIHGIRIEPGEVEHVIRDYPGLTDVAVVARPDRDGELALCAYYVADEPLDPDALREFAAARLPRTFVPSSWTHVEEFPLTQAGKIDWAGLPSPDIRQAEYAEPSTPAQRQVAEAMADVVGLDHVGSQDDFFAVGGDSLKAMQLVNQVEARTGVRIGLRDVFHNPRVDQLASLLTSHDTEFEPLKSVGGAGVYPASSGQRRLFVIDQLDPGSLAYHIPAVVRFSDRVDPQVSRAAQAFSTIHRLEEVFSDLVNRHEVLRTSFTTDAAGRVVQEVHDHVPTGVGLIQVDDIGDDSARAIMALFVRPFDLGEAPLVRLALVQGPDDESLLLFDAHHIILDGMSMTVLVDEFFRYFRGETLPDQTVEYKDYSSWLASCDMGAAKTHWADQFAVPPEPLDLPLDHPRPPLQTFTGSTLTRTIPFEVRVRVEETARRTGATEAMVLMAAWAAVLGRYGRTDDLVVGMPVSGRVHPDTERMLGMFVNTLPIRIGLHADSSFEELVGEVRDQVVDALTYQSYPLEDILDQVDLPRDPARNPLFDTALVVQNFTQPDLFRGGGDPDFVRMTSGDDTTAGGGDPDFVRMTGGDGVTARVVEIPFSGAKFDLSATVTPQPDDGYTVDLEYRTNLFEKETIDYLFRHLVTFLDQATSSPSMRVCEITMIDAEERSFLDDINDTEVPLPDARTIPELFARVVALYPDRAALICDGREVTYAELDERVRHIAARLRTLGVGRDDLVGVWIGRGTELIECILGVIVAGGAYIGMDTTWPEARAEQVLGSAHPAAILVNGAGLPCDENVPVLDISEPGFFDRPAPVVEPVNTESDLAYCIFTSGSTGEPKGVLIEHLGVCNLVTIAHQYGVSADDRILQYASIAFDASVWEWAQALLIGGTLVVPTEDEVNDVAWLNSHLTRDVTQVTAPVALIGHLDVSALLTLVSAGAQARPVERFTGTFVNGYGPTETTVCSTLWIHHGQDPWPDPVPIGRPRANAHVDVVGTHGELCGIGVPGEVCVAGIGLARGYLGDPELTARKFVTCHPADSVICACSEDQWKDDLDDRRRSCLRQDDSCRMYRTGDVAVWGPDGNLTYRGRVDTQVKVHGVRIEPGEIEHAIRDYPEIVDTVVVARPDNDGELTLCAYYVAPDESIDPDQLREFVSQRLPRTMVPSYWIRVDHIPVNHSGKTDVGALPDPDVRQTVYVEPSTPAELQVAAAMGEVLGLDRVGARDGFFALGGDSLKAMHLVNQIEAKTGVRLTLQDVFLNPSVDRLAKKISGLESHLEPIVSVGGAGTYPASPAQKRLFVIDQLDPQGRAYHVPSMLRIHGRIDPAWLRQVFQQLVARHEVLRTSFMADTDGAVLQRVHEHVDVDVPVIQTDDVSDQGAQVVLARFVVPFDLSHAPLVRMMLAQGPDDESLLLFDAHHIILDGTSMTLLVEEFSRLYRGESLEPENVDYKDYSAWFAAQDMGATRQYWADTFADPPTPLDLPTDHPRPPLQTFIGASLIRTIPAHLRERVEEIAHSSGATEAMVMMAAWGAVLARYGRTDDLTVGMPVSGRIHPNTERMLGLFVNTVPIRLRPHAEEPFDTYLADVRNRMVAALSNQAYPLDAILDDIDLPRDLARNPLFDTVLVFQNFDQPDPALAGLDAQVVPCETTGANLDMSVYVTPTMSGEYEVEISYRTDVYASWTIDYYFRHLSAFLDHATASADTPVGEIVMTDSDEQAFLDKLHDTAVPVRDVNVVTLFDEQVAFHPDTTAVIANGQEWTYRDLDSRANQIASCLRAAGVTHGQYVALFMGRELDMVAAILGVLKAGAAYVPVNTDLPRIRIGTMLDACHPAAVVTSGDLPEGVHVDCPVLDLASIPQQMGVAAPDDKPGLDDPAYAIFTSGSTGVPKPVVITHRSLTAFAQEPGLQDLLHSCDKPMFAATADYSFDMSVTEFFPGLCQGIPLALANPPQCVNQHDFARLVETSGATILQITPTRLRMLTADGDDRAYLAGIQLFLVGGEPVPEDLLQMLSETTPAPVWIMYGPTEATVWATMGRWNVGQPVTIGRGLANVRIHVRDELGDGCGIGVPGELCISGVGLAQGYLGDPQLTSEKFVWNDDGEIEYHTGDVACWGPDGNLTFLGRIDTQVKVHGVRIELGEIEHAIRDYPGIADAVAVTRPVQQEMALCAYFTTDPGLEVDVEGLRQFVSDRLPRTMLPSYWTKLDQLPLTRSGKTDTIHLPTPEVHFAGYISPSTPEECLVAEVMGDVLGVERVGVHDDFFALGGDSLKALQLVNQIEARSGARLRLQDVFQNPNVGPLADVVANQSGAYEPLVSVGGAGTYPTTAEQRQMLVSADEDTYQASVAIRLHGHLDPEQVGQVFQTLVDYHESLRTAFITQVDGQIVQEVRDHVDAKIEIVQVDDVSDQTARELLAGLAFPFDLNDPPLLRLKLAQGPHDQWLILIVGHHVILDGMSMTILIEEFCRVWRGEALPDQRVQYKDYAVWLTDKDSSDAVRFWSGLLKDPPPDLDMPYDHPRPPLLSFTNEGVTGVFPTELTAKVENLAHRTGTTEAMVVFAAFGAVLGRWAHSEDMLIGMTVSGRNHPDTKDMLGVFSNGMPLRVRPHPDSTFATYLAEIRDMVVPALAYQDYSYESIVNLVGPPLDPSRLPLMDVIFSFQNYTQPDVDLPGITSELIPSEDTGVGIDLAIFILPTAEGEYGVTIDYRSCLYDRTTIESLFSDWESLLDRVTTAPDSVLRDIPMTKG